MNLFDEKFIIVSANDELKELQEIEGKQIMRYPLYRQCYTDALRILFWNIRNNQDAVCEQGKKKAAKRMEIYPGLADNIIAFLGERGSGKTTCVTEFGDILKNFHRNRTYWERECGVEEGRFGRETHFMVLDPIDASLLDGEENIMELVWSEMCRLFEKNCYQSDRWGAQDELKREVIQNFNRVYKTYMNMGSEKAREEQLGDSVIAWLRNMPSSIEVRKLFGKLLDDFFELLGGEGCREYLVVTIDDLDLNLTKGALMLEQIYKYLSHPRVVVLITADMMQLDEICEKNAAHKLRRLTIKENNRMESLAGKMTQDYLLKVIPLMNRLYLPNKEVTANEIKVMTRKKENEADDKKHEELVDIKKLFMSHIARKTGIYYDAAGVKVHFCIPQNVRALVFYYNFWDMQLDIRWGHLGDQSKGGYSVMYRIYRTNIQRFLNDISGRMALDFLDKEQLTKFQTIRQRNAERRGRDIVELASSRMQGHPFKDRVDDRDYRYGDLVEGIYRWGREKYEDKPFTHVIMADLTADLTGRFYEYIYGREDSPKVKANREVLKNYIGNGFGNGWFGCMIPEIVFGFAEEKKYKNQLKQEAGEKDEKKNVANNTERKPENLGYIKNLRLDLLEWQYEIKIETGLLDELDSQLKLTMKGINEDTVRDLTKRSVERLINQCKNLRVLEELECFCMFIDASEISYDITFGWEKNDGDNKYSIRFFIRNKAKEYCFDVLGFLGKVLFEDRWYRAVENSIGESLKSWLNEIIQDIITKRLGEIQNTGENANVFLQADGQLEKAIGEEVESQIADYIKEASIWRKEKSGRDNNCIIDRRDVFPFYNFDMSYNVLKRVRRRMKKSGSVLQRSLYSHVQKIYGCIAYELYREDMFYFPNVTDPHCFSQRFLNDPFIRAFGVRLPDAVEVGEDKHIFEGRTGCLSESFAQNFGTAVRMSYNSMPESSSEPDEMN